MGLIPKDLYFVFIFISGEPKATWRKIPNDQSSLPWRASLIFFIKRNSESQTQTQVSYFTWVVFCSFLPLRPLWRGSGTLTSELITGPSTHNLADTFLCLMVTSYRFSNNFLWKPCSEILGWAESLAGQSCLLQSWGYREEKGLCPTPVPCLIHRRHRRNTGWNEKSVSSSGFSTD